MLQSTAANQPQIVSGGDLIKSGNHPAFEFTSNKSIYSNLEMHGINALDSMLGLLHDTADTNTFTHQVQRRGTRHGWIAQDGNSATIQLAELWWMSSLRLYANGTLVGGHDNNKG